MIFGWWTLDCRFTPDSSELHEITLIKLLYLYDPEACGRIYFYNVTIKVDNESDSSVMWPIKNIIAKEFRTFVRHTLPNTWSCKNAIIHLFFNNFYFKINFFIILVLLFRWQESEGLVGPTHHMVRFMPSNSDSRPEGLWLLCDHSAIYFDWYNDATHGSHICGTLRKEHSSDWHWRFVIFLPHVIQSNIQYQAQRMLLIWQGTEIILNIDQPPWTPLAVLMR